MKTRYFKIVGIAAAALFGFASCQDFLEDVKNYDSVNTDLYNDWDGVLGRLSDVYALCLPSGAYAGNSATYWQYPSTGANNDHMTKSTEEYSGLTDSFLDPRAIFSPTETVPDFFQGQDRQNVRNNSWGLIRNINDAIEGIQGGSLPQSQKEIALGQLYFMRAWRYFLMWKWYGGIPIIDHVQPIEASSATPRSSSKEVYDFIIKDLDNAAQMLESATGAGQWIDGDNYGRVTTGTALALKTRVMAWWCSPLFNRSGDMKRYEEAYKILFEDENVLDKIKDCKYGFSYGNADQWADMFNTIGGNKDAIFFARHNDISPGGNPDYQRNNNWERSIRPSNAIGGGGLNPSKMIIDLFPMGDGKLPAGKGSTLLPHSADTYNAEYPFLNRDPRFYRTFAFPGMQWKFVGTATSGQGNLNPFDGDDYELWNYVWYDTADKVSDSGASGYGADNLLANVKGVYVTKRSAATPSKGAYTWPSNDDKNATGFQKSYASFIELRYAEVLLNLAEIACGAGKPEKVIEYLKMVRNAVGANSSVFDELSGNPALFAAILYERQIELAFEGKRFDDMRRWMLFDGGENIMQVSGAKPHWKLGGEWAQGTCKYLGVEPLNGHRRENMEYRVKDGNGVGKTTWKDVDDMPDPIAKASGKSWEEFKNWRSQYSVDLSSATLQEHLNTLVRDFYTDHLAYKDKKGDNEVNEGTDNEPKMKLLEPYFAPQCYFLGFSSGVQSNNPTLPNTIGWGNGTFDPLSDIAK